MHGRPAALQHSSQPAEGVFQCPFCLPLSCSTCLWLPITTCSDTGCSALCFEVRGGCRVCRGTGSGYVRGGAGPLGCFEGPGNPLKCSGTCSPQDSIRVLYDKQQSFGPKVTAASLPVKGPFKSYTADTCPGSVVTWTVFERGLRDNMSYSSCISL